MSVDVDISMLFWELNIYKLLERLMLQLSYNQSLL